ncbi:MAG: D-aminoacyl-tRNA deacylase [Candidatus Cloacimonadota bacterium]|nr:D-aminoacyl-tRNA deacylase [Candidatus Cloacimonadota bacterium]
MKIVLQRVKKAVVEVKGQQISSISKGLLLFLGIAKNDGEEQLNWLAKKIIGLRIFEDEDGKMNRSIIDISGEILLISQFTLCADCKKGRRPSFDKAALPKLAEKYYLQFADKLNEFGIKPQLGVFGAEMEIDLVNDGPVTIILER